MTAIIPNLNQYLYSNITGSTPIIFGYDANLKDKTEYISVDYDTGSKDSGATPQSQELGITIEAFTRSENAYAIFTLAKKILDVIKHKIKLPTTNEVIFFSAININFLDLEEGKKAIITARITYWR